MREFVGREDRITSLIKHHDRKLFCERNREGKLCIYRENYSWFDQKLACGSTLRFLRPTPHLVFALTHNWSVRGNAVDWGIEPILARLKAMDLWNRDVVGELIDNYEQAEVSQERDMKNNIESFLYDFRSQFKKTFSDVNTASMEKKDLRKTREKSWNEKFK